TVNVDAAGTISVTSSGITIAALLGVIQPMIDRPVINKAVLTDVYDVTLRFSPEDSTRALPNLSTSSTGGSQRADASGPSIFTAILDLGLRLQSSKAPLDVLVIDSVQRPSEN